MCERERVANLQTDLSEWDGFLRGVPKLRCDEGGGGFNKLVDKMASYQ